MLAGCWLSAPLWLPADCRMLGHTAAMFRLLLIFVHGLVALFMARGDLVLENLALRQQVAAMKERRPRPRLSGVDRLFWVLLRRLWPRWDHVLVLVEPATVVRWHRAGFRLWWRWKSRAMKPGRPRIERELRSLIRRMAQENPVWGAPRIHAELSKLGFEVSERTVSRYLPRRLAPKDVVERWKAFLRNHRADIAAMDLFTVPTASFGVLYVFFVIHHARRRVLHFGVTGYPKSAWVIQQLRETFLMMRPRAFSCSTGTALSVTRWWPPSVPLGSSRSAPLSALRGRTASPNDGWAASAARCRRGPPDHVVVLGDTHLHRLLREYVAYYNEDRCHLSLEKDAPWHRRTSCREEASDRVVAHPRVGGIHHRYEWRRAA
jgi:putative transposase